MSNQLGNEAMCIDVSCFTYNAVNAVFAPHIDCVRSYSKHLYENKGRISHVCYVSR